ncbi:MAG TPA: zinc ribbon domain-containing protein [Anaerolineales bacterium]|nr:zinc ribbon domain-containing protein [Anaerolineales bacterium]
MDQRIYHGPISPQSLGQCLVGEFDRGDLRAQMLGDEDQVLVQIASRSGHLSGGPTALTVQLSRVEDGVLARLGQQEWLGVAASLGTTALWALRNPWTLLGRLDDLAQDLTSLQLSARVWDTVDRAAHSLGASHDISERLRRLTCTYCLTANEVGAPSCIACGAPLGPDQPRACPRCGYVVPTGTSTCPNCGASLTS